MYSRNRIAVVIPAYRDDQRVAEQAGSVPEYVDRTYVLNTGAMGFINEFRLLLNPDQRIAIIRRTIQDNQAAIPALYPSVLQDAIDIVVFMAPDSPLDYRDLPFLLDPIVWKLADCTQGKGYTYAPGRVSAKGCSSHAVLVSQMKLTPGFPELFGTFSGNMAVSRTAFEMLHVRAGRGAKTRVLAAVPGWGQEPAIGPAVAKVRPYVDEVLVVDDGSVPGRAQHARDAGALVVRPQSSGYAGVLRTCFAYARESGFSAMILLYEDGMREPDEIPGLLSPILGGKSDAAVASWLAENHVKAAKGRRVSPRGTVDSRVGMIALSAGAVTALDTGNLRSTLESGVLALLASSGLRVAEVPIITEAKEGAGESSNPLVGVYNFGVRFIARIFYTHPLVLFGLSGILLIGIAVFLWSRSITIEALLMSLTFGSTFASGILLVLGILLCISGLILNLIRTLEKAKETKRSEGANCR